MLGLVGIEFWIEVIDSQHPPQGLDLIVIPRQMQPASPVLISVAPILPQGFRGVFFWIDGDGKKYDILTNTIPEHFVNLHEVLGHPRSYPTASGIEELDGDDSILDQVAIETVFAA